jgi:peptidoglycan-associated lipoprotein
VEIKVVDEKTGEVVKLSFQTVYFDYDKYNIRPDARPAIEANARELNKVANLKIIIEGHCDERGTTEYNLALGEHRAVAVMQALAGAGVGKDRLKTVSYGKERPVDPGHDEAAWAKNRRGVIRES